MGKMKLQIERFLKATLKTFDIGIARYSKLRWLEEYPRDAAALLALPAEKLNTLVSLVHKSRSQRGQDLFALAELDFKKNGYFVEFGATNGIDLSNTYLLERDFGWCGILAEPARCWHQALNENRNSKIETDCVWRDSKSLLQFKEVDVAELSTIAAYRRADMHGPEREGGRTYSVSTISLNDLLEKYNAPRNLDYLSIDTEGSEFEILSTCDFDRYQFKVITCEHNFTPMREKIFKLLTKHGYERRYIGFSQQDDWYVKLT